MEGGISQYERIFRLFPFFVSEREIPFPKEEVYIFVILLDKYSWLEKRPDASWCVLVRSEPDARMRTFFALGSLYRAWSYVDDFKCIQSDCACLICETYILGNHPLAKPSLGQSMGLWFYMAWCIQNLTFIQQVFLIYVLNELGWDWQQSTLMASSEPWQGIREKRFTLPSNSNLGAGFAVHTIRTLYWNMLAVSPWHDPGAVEILVIPHKTNVLPIAF